MRLLYGPMFFEASRMAAEQLLALPHVHEIAAPC